MTRRAFVPSAAGIAITAQAADPPKNSLIELRRYQLRNSSDNQRQRATDFARHEAEAFERAGGQPVFFGETLIGASQPNLVYMLSYADLADRDKVWKAFAADSGWQKLRATPGLSDAEIVSNIGNWLVTPLAFSQIR